MNWSARGNVLNQYLRNTSIGTTVIYTANISIARGHKNIVMIKYCVLHEIMLFSVSALAFDLCGFIARQRLPVFNYLYKLWLFTCS